MESTGVAMNELLHRSLQVDVEVSREGVLYIELQEWEHTRLGAEPGHRPVLLTVVAAQRVIDLLQEQIALADDAESWTYEHAREHHERMQSHPALIEAHNVWVP